MNRTSGEKVHDEREGGEQDNDPFQDFEPSRGCGIGQLLIDAFEGLELSENAGVPLCQVEARGHEPIDAGKVLIAEQLERIVDAFEQHSIVDLQLADGRDGERPW